MSELLNGLNDMQTKAVLATDGPLLVLAGAGSGKTTVLTRRIAYILSLHKARPWQILAITFTNKAAKEMQERISQLVPESAGDMWIKTFHSACLRILRRDIDKLGYDTNFNVYDTNDQKRIAKQCLKDCFLNEDNYPVKTILSKISDCKNRGVSPEEFLKECTGDYHKTGYAKLYAQYQNILKANNSLDFDDLLWKTVELFETNAETLKYYQDKFKYILVDEYQDTNHIQYKLVAMLAQAHRNICVVGDDDQSIYKFRGADVTNILDFEKQFADAVVIKLEQNYRSTQNILDSANSVIANNKNRKAKNLWTEQKGGDLIHFRNLDDQIGEAVFINNTIESYVRSGEYKYSDFAVLYRTNAQTRAFEENFTCPYRILAGLRFYDRREIKDMLSYLRVLFNPDDDANLERIINVPKRGIGDTTVAKIASLASTVGKSMYKVMCDPSYADAIGRSFNKISEFSALLEDLRSKINKISTVELIDEIISRTGYIEALIAENHFEAQGRIENLEELKSKAAEYEQSVEEHSFDGFLDNISLVSDVDNYDTEQDAVVLMTLHSAKGLEFPVVFMCGMEYGLFPSLMSELEEGGKEEERRLCYVGITRAKKVLYMTAAKMRTTYGKTESRTPSLFIDEIPESLFDDKYMQNRRIRTYSQNSEYEYSKPKSDSMPKFSFGTSGQSKPTVGGIMSAYKMSTASNMHSQSSFDVKKGDRVKHKKFGEGLVIDVKPSGGDYQVEISFDNVGTRTLMASFAKLEKI